MKTTMVTLALLSPMVASANTVVGSMTKEEVSGTSTQVVTTGSTIDKAGNQVTPNIPQQDLDRLKFSDDFEYRFKQDDEIPAYAKWYVTNSKRLRVMPDGRARFVVRKGSLEENLTVLFKEHTRAIVYFSKDFPSSMRFHNTFVIEGDNSLDIANQLVDPFRATNNAHGWAHVNNVVEFSAAVSY
ncbi:hypothetical protein AAFX24_28385 [Vibrio mediterranei]|uniref:hypothetical protein n=1 Tax=Vibrio mediterranei TaxID=689 RepID=UPI0038CE7954